MKNNQFRAYLDKYIKKRYQNTIVLTLDKDSNTRICYLYTQLTGDCIGSLILYFTNEYVNISYSKNNDRVCKLTNQRASKQFDYCELKQAIIFLDEAVNYFIEGGRYAKN